MTEHVTTITKNLLLQ